MVLACPPETGPGRVLGFGSGDRFSEEVRNEQETTHARANHHGTSAGGGKSGERYDEALLHGSEFEDRIE